MQKREFIAVMIFQSTPPVKAATCSDDTVQFQIKISIHAAREGGDIAEHQHHNRVRISIHAAREGGDYGKFGMNPNVRSFQSTPPVKAAT